MGGEFRGNLNSRRKKTARRRLSVAGWCVGYLRYLIVGSVGSFIAARLLIIVSRSYRPTSSLSHHVAALPISSRSFIAKNINFCEFIILAFILNTPKDAAPKGGGWVYTRWLSIKSPIVMELISPSVIFAALIASRSSMVLSNSRFFLSSSLLSVSS